jgi:stage II sporulation protein GA (sporulation sigma-E factor processing peptidase)
MRNHIGFQQIVQVELTYGGQTVKLNALRDTGNTLRDPVTGKSVLVVGADIADRLTGLSRRQLSEPVETISEIPGMRLIPYRAVGQPSGLLLALPVRKSKIGGKKYH